MHYSLHEMVYFEQKKGPASPLSLNVCKSCSDAADGDDHRDKGQTRARQQAAGQAENHNRACEARLIDTDERGPHHHASAGDVAIGHGHEDHKQAGEGIIVEDDRELRVGDIAQ